MATEITIHKIEVRRNGHRLGYLWVAKQGLQWKPVGSRKWGNITWLEFDTLMADRAERLGRHRWKLG